MVEYCSACGVKFVFPAEDRFCSRCGKNRVRNSPEVMPTCTKSFADFTALKSNERLSRFSAKRKIQTKSLAGRGDDLLHHQQPKYSSSTSKKRKVEQIIINVDVIKENEHGTVAIVRGSRLSVQVGTVLSCRGPLYLCNTFRHVSTVTTVIIGRSAIERKSFL